MTKKTSLLFVLLSLAAFVVYWLTLAPSITWQNQGADSGDFATAIAVGGVPHPPGFPTYLLLGDLFNLLPFGDVAYRLNVLSAVAAALTIGLTGLIVFERLPKPAKYPLAWFCAVSAALTLAFSTILWSQALISEVYTVLTFFCALLLWLALKSSPANQQWLLPTLALLIGLGLGVHLSIIFFLPAVFSVLSVKWRWQNLITFTLALCLGAAVYLTLPLRALDNPPVNWGNATTWKNFVWLVTAQVYRPYLFDTPLAQLLPRVRASLNILSDPFFGWGLALSLLGLYQLWQRQRRLAVGSGVSILALFGYVITYHTKDSYIYFLPALILMSVWIGWGLFDVARMLRTRFNYPYAIGLVMVALPLAALGVNFSSQNLSRDAEALDFARNSLQTVPENAVIIVDDDNHTFALWYGRYALQIRPDVAIVHLGLLQFDWYRDTLKRTHPHLQLTDTTGRPTKNLRAFVNRNSTAFVIYMATVNTSPIEGTRPLITQ